jgi:hypothetical protein
MSFKVNRLVSAAYIAFGAAVVGSSYSPSVLAQSNATGTIFGQVAAEAGNSIGIENVETGAKRTVVPDATGRYQATALPTGRYKVTLSKNGQIVETRDLVEVRIGQGSEVVFGATKALQTVTVAGRKQTIDPSTVDSTTSFTAAELERLPIASNVGAIVQLAPGTTRGDSRYGGSNAPSFGGSGASENAFYINGFPVTNPLLQIGGGQLPFDSIAQAQVLTGGYGAEFGRSTGGVVNITTKSGTNTWMVGGGLTWEPDKLRSTPKSSLYPNLGFPTDGTYFFYNGDDKRDVYSGNAYISGPIIKDKLFMYIAAEQNRTDTQTTRLESENANAAVNGWQERQVKIPRYLAKFDWNITDNHHLEFTRIGEKVEDDREYYAFDYATLQRGFVQNGGDSYVNWGPVAPAAQLGTDVNILKYTGYLTDDLTLTALYGRTKTPHKQNPFNYNPSVFRVVSTPAARAPGLTYNNLQPTANILVPGALDETKGYRVDVEYKLTPKHLVRAGIDRLDIESLAGTSRAGGGQWTYFRSVPPTTPIDSGRGGVAANGTPLGDLGYYVLDQRIATKSTPSVEQAAQYVEDRWQATDNLLFVLGLRNEQFTNKNGDGEAYAKQRHQLAPRLGASWDVAGDSSFKVYGSLGRYHLPLPTNVAIRGAGSSLNTRQAYTYTGTDPVTGAPTGLTPLSGVYSLNGEFGQARDARTVAATDLKANYQDEFAIGFAKALNPQLNVGAKFTFRTLRSAIDDFCDGRPFDAWAARNGIDTTADPFADNFNCALFNPGQANSFLQDVNGDGVLEKVDLSAEDLGYPKVKRRYFALDFFFEKPFDGKWYARLDYTFSKNYGNTEGQLLSDIGQGDVATTQAFDFPEISEGSNGLLPNDRRHQFKAIAYYQATPEWGFGVNGLLASGRPKNCIGSYPDPNNAASAYGSAFFYCDGVGTPRGSKGRLPWDFRIDANVIYKPEFAKGLQFKVDAFNLLNRQAAETIDELYNEDSGQLSATYGRVISYTAPRAFRLSVQYDYQF